MPVAASLLYAACCYQNQIDKKFICGGRAKKTKRKNMSKQNEENKRKQKQGKGNAKIILVEKCV